MAKTKASQPSGKRRQTPTAKSGGGSVARASASTTSKTAASALSAARRPHGGKAHVVAISSQPIPRELVEVAEALARELDRAMAARRARRRGRS